MKVTDAGFEVTGRPTFICDFSPPRSGNPQDVSATIPDADFLLVNRNPGRAVRADSAMAATLLRQRTGREVIFAFLTRDMNRLAVQSYLLGAQLLGLENVVVARGDRFAGRDTRLIRDVSDYRTTELIAALSEMNRSEDLRGRRLDSPTDFCVGATLDLSQGLESEAQLAARKVEAGARFLVTQPVYTTDDMERFYEGYEKANCQTCPVPIYWGLQLMEAGGVAFGSVPPRYREELAAGRSGVEIALEVYALFQEAGMRNTYLLPPILPGGERGYEAASEFLEAARAMGR